VTDFAFSSFVVHGFGIGFRVRQEAKQKAAAEAKAKAEAEAKLKQEEAAKQKAAAEAKANTEADRKAAEAKRQQEEDKHKQETALNQLAEMGLTDRNGNKKLLEQSRNDVATVVDLLSQEASTDQRRENEGGRGRSVESGGARGRGSCLEEGRCYVDTSRNLGSGSFADVGRDVSIPRTRCGHGGRNLASRVREKIKEVVELGMKLLHPNLVILFGMLNHDQYGPVLVLQLCPGGSLSQVLDRALPTLVA
jgi:ribonucleotide reductase alpha subunit